MTTHVDPRAWERTIEADLGSALDNDFNPERTTDMDYPTTGFAAQINAKRDLDPAIMPLRKAIEMLRSTAEQVQDTADRIAGLTPPAAGKEATDRTVGNGLFGELETLAHAVLSASDSIRRNMDRVSCRL